MKKMIMLYLAIFILQYSSIVSAQTSDHFTLKDEWQKYQKIANLLDNNWANSAISQKLNIVRPKNNADLEKIVKEIDAEILNNIQTLSTFHPTSYEIRKLISNKKSILEEFNKHVVYEVKIKNGFLVKENSGNSKYFMNIRYLLNEQTKILQEIENKLNPN